MRKRTQTECEVCRLGGTIGSVLPIPSLMLQQCSIVPLNRTVIYAKILLALSVSSLSFFPPLPWPLLSRSQFCTGAISSPTFQRPLLFRDTLSPVCSFVQRLHSASPCSLLAISFLRLHHHATCHITFFMLFLTYLL